MSDALDNSVLRILTVKDERARERLDIDSDTNTSVSQGLVFGSQVILTSAELRSADVDVDELHQNS